MRKRTSRKIPSIYVDEHLPPDIVAVFRNIFRTIEISQTRRFKGRDEADYLDGLYRDNRIFITSDTEFVRIVRDKRSKHSGLLYTILQISRDVQIFYAELIANFIRGACFGADSPFVFRRCVVYDGDDGLHTNDGKTDELEFSCDWFKLQL